MAGFASACAGVEPPKLIPTAGTVQPAPASSPQAVVPPATVDGATTSAKPADVQSPVPNPDRLAATAQGETIVGLKKDTIVLYREENGFEGERIVAASFSLPSLARRAAGNPRRLEIVTAAGVRWVDRAAVVVNALTP